MWWQLEKTFRQQERPRDTCTTKATDGAPQGRPGFAKLERREPAIALPQAQKSPRQQNELAKPQAPEGWRHQVELAQPRPPENPRPQVELARPRPPESPRLQVERDFWQRTLRKQRNLNIITFLGVAAAVAAFFVLRSTLHEAQKATGFALQQAKAVAGQAEIVQQKFELSERPWIFPEKIELAKPLTYKGNRANLTLRFLLHNTGRSPAAATQVKALAFVEMPDKSDLMAEQQRFCGPVGNQPVSPHSVGYTVFPNQRITLTINTSIEREEIDADIAYWKHQFAQRRNAKQQRRTVVPMRFAIVGCIDYHFDLSDEHHQTPFILQLSRYNPERPESVLNLEAYKDTPLKELRLDQFFEAGGDAT